MRCTKCLSEFVGNFCPNCGTPAKDTEKKRGVVLGFRSNKKWKKILFLKNNYYFSRAIGS